MEEADPGIDLKGIGRAHSDLVDIPSLITKKLIEKKKKKHSSTWAFPKNINVYSRVFHNLFGTYISLIIVIFIL